MAAIPSCETTIPRGELGLAFGVEDNVVTIVGISPDSELRDVFEPGDSFESLTLGNGVLVEQPTVEELVDLLNSTTDDPLRKMKVNISRRRA